MRYLDLGDGGDYAGKGMTDFCARLCIAVELGEESLLQECESGYLGRARRTLICVLVVGAVFGHALLFADAMRFRASTAAADDDY